MQFNSFIFILAFMPIVILLYYLANRWNTIAGKIVVFAAGVVFYAYEDWHMLIILAVSLGINYGFSKIINNRNYKILVVAPIAVNIGLLLYYKYFNFAIENVNSLFGLSLSFRNIVMPLGISFFTFQQIAYIISIYHGEIEDNSLIDYLCYITFFTKILMGPLMDPVDFVKQFNDDSRKSFSWDNMASGIKIFSYGLIKKSLFADTFAKAVSWGFENSMTASAMDWILITIFYSLEIYFDFSGYSDMAVGSSLMLGIELPINFDSPYKALSVSDFWKRWHISLTKFFTKYIYIPLGGNRKGLLRTCINTMIVFIISGIWHGANWTFIIWGVLYGILLVIERVFKKGLDRLFVPFRWLITLIIVFSLWLLFRSESFVQWVMIMATMLNMQNTTISWDLINTFSLPENELLESVFYLSRFAHDISGFWMWLLLGVSFIICFVPENNYKTLRKLSIGGLILAIIAFVYGLMSLSSDSVFIYNFF